MFTQCYHRIENERDETVTKKNFIKTDDDMIKSSSIDENAFYLDIVSERKKIVVLFFKFHCKWFLLN